jgi:pyruvate-ferredoxin/flavodoxin oxidoreductase
VAQIALGASDTQTNKAMLEAEAWPGPSLIIAYSTCIAHGIDMSTSMTHQKDAVKSGFWPLYRYVPSEADGQPFKLDSKAPSIPIKEFVESETRFAILQRTQPQRAAELVELSQADADERWRYYSQLAGVQRSIPHLEHEPAAAPVDRPDAGDNGKGESK